MAMIELNVLLDQIRKYNSSDLSQVEKAYNMSCNNGSKPLRKA